MYTMRSKKFEKIFERRHWIFIRLRPKNAHFNTFVPSFLSSYQSRILNDLCYIMIDTRVASSSIFRFHRKTFNNTNDKSDVKYDNKIDTKWGHCTICWWFVTCFRLYGKDPFLMANRLLHVRLGIRCSSTHMVTPTLINSDLVPWVLCM